MDILADMLRPVSTYMDRTGPKIIRSDPMTNLISTQNWKKERHLFRPQTKVNKSW